MVRMWPFTRVLMSSIIAASVVDLPEPVLPVTRIRPLLARHSVWHGLRQLELLHRQRLRRNGAHHRAHAVQLAHHVHAEAAVLAHVVGEVGAVVLLEALHRGLRHDFVQRVLHEVLLEPLGAQRLQVAVQADARRIAGEEMQVRALLAQHFLQIFVDDGHGDLSYRRRPGGRARDIELGHQRGVGDVALERRAGRWRR